MHCNGCKQQHICNVHQRKCKLSSVHFSVRNIAFLLEKSVSISCKHYEKVGLVRTPYPSVDCIFASIFMPVIDFLIFPHGLRIHNIFVFWSYYLQDYFVRPRNTFPICTSLHSFSNLLLFYLIPQINN